MTSALPSTDGKPVTLTAAQAELFASFLASQGGAAIPATVAAVGAAQAARGGAILGTAAAPVVKREAMSVPAPSGKGKTVPTVAALAAAYPGGYRLTVSGLASDGSETVLAVKDTVPAPFASGSWGLGFNGARVTFNTPGGPASLVLNANMTQADSKPKA